MPMFVIPFPEIDPILFQIGPFAIRWYALAYIAGLVLGWRYIVKLLTTPHIWPPSNQKKKVKFAPNMPATPLDIDDLLVWITLGVILGGRIGYVLFYQPAMIFQEPARIFAVWQGGMSFHGGFLGVIVGGALFCLKHKLDIIRVGDLVAATAPIGLFFGRIANFINSELWGRTTDMPWGVIFPNGGPLPRHPSQLYEAFLEGIVLFIVLRLSTHHARSLFKPGFTMGLFMIGYGASRIVIEFFRKPDAHIGYLAGDFVTMGMILSLPMILAGAAFVWRTSAHAPSWLLPRPLSNSGRQK